MYVHHSTGGVSKWRVTRRVKQRGEEQREGERERERENFKWAYNRRRRRRDRVAGGGLDPLFI
jgi:hypothetical protein